MDNPEGFKMLPLSERGRGFASGAANPHGLKMKLYSNGESLYSPLSVPDYMSGWNRVVHGGIVSTILDEIMGWGAIYLLQKIVFTKNINVEFIKPLFVGEPLEVRSRVAERVNEGEALMAAELFNDSGEKCATASGTFRLFSLERARETGFFEERVVRWFEELFADIPLARS